MKTIVDMLKTTHIKKECICIHSNIEDTAKFVFGYILGVDDDYYAISMFTPDGIYDGILIKKTSTIQYIEQPIHYVQKMNRLISYHQNDFSEVLELSISNNVFLWGLSYAKEKQFIVSLEINLSGITDINGIIVEIHDDICFLKQIDEMGIEDGMCYVPLNNITQICINSSDEKRLMILYKS